MSNLSDIQSLDPETDLIESSTPAPEVSSDFSNTSVEVDKTTTKDVSSSEGDSAPIAGGEKNWLKIRLQKVTDLVEEWKHLRSEIKAFPARVNERMKEIENHFMVYRLTFAGLTYKAPRIEEEIHEVYSQIVEQIPLLEERTKKRPLIFRNLQTLRELNQDWLSILEKQEHLIGLLQKAPRGMDFYNRMQIIREQRRQEELRQKENQQRIEAAYESLKKALSYVEHQCRDDEPIIFGSEVLTLEDAQKVWNEHITEILTMKDLKNASVETVLARAFTRKD
ncbi:MAG: hypothetical protein AB1522_09725 [Chloroflexota bacterium]